MVNNMVTTNGKVIKVSAENYSQLKHAKYEMELESINEVVSMLLQEHHEKKEEEAR